MKAKVIMLETTDKSIIHKFDHKDFMWTIDKEDFATNTIAYHFYLIDESAEIGEGDWYIANNKVYKCHEIKFTGEIRSIFNGTEHYLKKTICHKIIASTDKSLLFDNKFLHNVHGIEMESSHNKLLPQLSKQSIQLLIDYYNQYGKMPDEVDIKSEKLAKYGKVLLPCSPYNNESNSDMSIYKEYIKLNSEGTVDITIPKEITLTQKQAELMLSQFICEYVPETSSKFNAGIYLNNWIKENLK